MCSLPTLNIFFFPWVNVSDPRKKESFIFKLEHIFSHTLLYHKFKERIFYAIVV